jgi:DNA repair exonuclease SbcCD nuclease subunit
MSMKIIYFTDPHHASVGPRMRIDDYMQTTFNKLDEIKTIAKKEKCEALLVSGDWFNLKAQNRNPYVLVNRLIDYYKSLGIPIYGIFGDHDLADRCEENLERQPLGALVRGAGIQLLSKGDEIELESGVFVTGAPKTDPYEEDITNYVPTKPLRATKSWMHLVHGDLYPKRPVYEPHTLYSALKDSQADFTLRGHIHRNDGIVQVGKTKIVGIGSLTRGTFNTDSISRRPSIAVINTDGNAVKVIELKSAPKTEDIFDLVNYEKQEKASAEIDKLGDLIKQESAGIEVNSLDGIKQLIKESKTIDSKVKDECFKLLDKAEEFV